MSKDKEISIEEWKKIVGDIEGLGFTVLDNETTDEEDLSED